MRLLRNKNQSYILFILHINVKFTFKFNIKRFELTLLASVLIQGEAFKLRHLNISKTKHLKKRKRFRQKFRQKCVEKKKIILKI